MQPSRPTRASKQNSGFSTIELLVAMTILILCLTAVLLVSSGNSSLLLDSQLSREAISIAQKELEIAQSLARKDFQLVNPTSSDVTLGRKEYGVQTTIQNQNFNLEKVVKTEVKYSGQFGRNQTTELYSLVTNFNNAKATNTCNSNLQPDADAWKTPHTLNTSTDFATLVGLGGGTFPITDLDAYRGKLYVTTNNSATNQATFFSFDLADPKNPSLQNQLDNDPTNKAGLNALAVDEGFAYVANASSPAVLGQLQIINLNSFTVIRSIKAAGVSGITGAQGLGNSITYKDGYVYLGLKSTGGHGPEFHIFDVHTASNPVETGSWTVGNDINAIEVKGKYAYLATPNSQELLVLDVSDPTNIKTGSPAYGFDATGSGNGKSIQVVGNTVYLGRTAPSSGPKFYVLDASDPTKLSLNNPNPKTLDPTSSVDGFQFRSGLGIESASGKTIPYGLGFLLTRSALEIYNLDDLMPWSPNKNVSEFLNLPASESAVFEPVMDCENNYFYLGVSNSSNKGSLYVVGP